MKILFVGLSRAIWLFETSQLNPTGLSLQPVIEKLTEKYKFSKAPKNPLDYDEQKTLAFKGGTFTNSKGVPVMITFLIYSDGLVADTTSNTNDSGEFLSQVTGWLTTEFGLLPPPEIRKAYVNQMDVECSTELIQVNPKLKSFLDSVESRVKSADGKARRFELGGLSFWTEDITKPGAPAAIKFERKFNAPWSANHYFSQAPLETNAHLELLNELEALLKA
jgi:hypothetical protein